jgi:hypothetical protein
MNYCCVTGLLNAFIRALCESGIMRGLAALDELAPAIYYHSAGSDVRLNQPASRQTWTEVK